MSVESSLHVSEGMQYPIVHPLHSFSHAHAAAQAGPFPTGGLACLQGHVLVGGVTVYNPFLMPFMIFGICVGLLGVRSLAKHRANTKGGLIYSIMFLFFAGMNTSGFFANAFFPSGWTNGTKSSSISSFFALADAYCTSVVNFCFILCSLVDVGLLKERSLPFNTLIVAGLSLIGYGYHQTFNGHWKNGFVVLYLELCEVGFLTFVICALVFIFHNKSVWKGAAAGLVLAVLSGALGIKSLTLGDWFCNHLSLWINNIIVWFFFSDTALLSLLFYFLWTLKARETQPQHIEDAEAVIVLVPVDASMMKGYNPAEVAIPYEQVVQSTKI
eukprot:TRINITY_DN2892_c0_g1_i2.p1 TRINITY_DN2892_c0_g1~~TRINITY_DN2892_c0_g1_i2.p1  ORF type:complete len:351 (-),score=130.79 TRINITY_DN2892_c0_g1_i2:124-1107(-)